MKSLKRSKTRKVFFGIFLALAMVVGVGTSFAQKLPLTVEAASGEYVIDFWNPSKLNDGANSTLINKAYVNGKSSKTLSDVTNISTVYQERKGGIGFGSSKSPAGSFTLSLPTTVSKAHVYATNWTGTETPTLSVGGAASQTVSLSHGTLEENTVIDDLTPYEFDFSATNSVKFASASKRLVILQIVLNPSAPLVVSTIEVQKEPDKMDYYVGEAFNKTGLEVKANYVGGTSGIVDNNDVTVTPSKMSLGITSVELDYQGAKTTLSGITVESAPTVNSLSISGTANKTEYFAGETFEYDGLTVTAHLSNGKTENVTSLATYTPDPLELGDDEITITYQGVSTTYGPITINAGPTIVFNSIFGEDGENSWAVKSGKFESYFGHAYGGKGTLTLESIKLPNHPVNTEYKVSIVATSVASPGTSVTVYGVNAAGNNIAGITKSANMRYGNYSGNLTNAKTDAYSHPTLIELPLSAVEKLDKIKIVFGSSPNFLLFEINVEAIIAADTSYEDAKAFANWLMDSARDSESCEDKFYEAWGMWEDLSKDAKTEFKAHADFTAARARLLNWIIANGGDSFDDLDFNGSGAKTVNHNSNALNAVLIIGLLGLTTVAGYYFVSKKRKFN